VQLRKPQKSSSKLLKILLTLDSKESWSQVHRAIRKRRLRFRWQSTSPLTLSTALLSPCQRAKLISQLTRLGSWERPLLPLPWGIRSTALGPQLSPFASSNLEFNPRGNLRLGFGAILPLQWIHFHLCKQNEIKWVEFKSILWNPAWVYSFFFLPCVVEIEWSDRIPWLMSWGWLAVVFYRRLGIRPSSWVKRL